MIRVEGLVKRFGEIHAVDGVSFEVREGEIYGLLGPNGAGKTTTFSMIAGLLSADSGRITVGGVDIASDPVAVKRQ
ncbi:MAG TPA: ATP-binding cassette domain-containing protein, partial [Thermoanaerobaculia bacterium]|nr:ATP-binding cassette domain-containing protein [Thermoanaerobaculia bacterium]